LEQVAQAPLLAKADVVLARAIEDKVLAEGTAAERSGRAVHPGRQYGVVSHRRDMDGLVRPAMMPPVGLFVSGETRGGNLERERPDTVAFSMAEG